MHSHLLGLAAVVVSSGLQAGSVPILAPRSALAQETGSPEGASRTTQTLERIEEILRESQGLQRAINLARTTATQLNGGLSLYRPASCMFAGISNNPCLISREGGSFVFRFSGGAPGWEQLKLAPVLETEIRISGDGRSVIQIIYNGFYRSPATAS
jgi:hypothetical protein